jgi:hypothetical protein
MLVRRSVSRKEDTSVGPGFESVRQRSVKRTHLHTNIMVIKRVLFEARLGERVSPYVL